MQYQGVFVLRGSRLARKLVCRAMSANAAPAAKRRRESADAAGRLTALQWGDSFSLPGLIVQNLSMRVPLALEQPEGGEQITVFARLISSSSRSRDPTGPFLLFLQGFSPPHPAPPKALVLTCSILNQKAVLRQLVHVVLFLLIRKVSDGVSVGDSSRKLLCARAGGPGFESPRPLDSSGWLKSATEHYRCAPSRPARATASTADARTNAPAESLLDILALSLILIRHQA